MQSLKLFTFAFSLFTSNRDGETRTPKVSVPSRVAKPFAVTPKKALGAVSTLRVTNAHNRKRSRFDDYPEKLALAAGLEPATFRLTDGLSTT